MYETDNNRILVFVYGTLKQGFGNHRLLDTSTFIGEGVTVDKFDMVNLVGFPGLVIGNTSQITGEIYEVTEDVLLNSLDRLEGYPNFYDRKVIPVQVNSNGIVFAWAYILNDPSYYRDRHVIQDGVWKKNMYSYLGS